MEAIIWKKKFNLGIRRIDEHHQLLVKYINRLAATRETEQSRTDVEKILNCLVNYTVRHFGYEEYLFNKYGYDEQEEHEREHQVFVRQLMKFKQRFEQHEAEISVELIDFLKSWLIQHILVSDAEYAPHLKKQVTDTIKRTNPLWQHPVSFDH